MFHEKGTTERPALLFSSFCDDPTTRMAFLRLNTHVESVYYKFQPCLTPALLPKMFLVAMLQQNVDLNLEQVLYPTCPPTPFIL